MRFGTVAIVALVASATLCGVARAQCATAPGPVVAAGPAERGYVDRYNALVAHDPYLELDGTAQPWRDLVAELKRDPAVSPALLARGQMMLSQSDAPMREALAAAREARSIAEGAGLAESQLHAEILTALVFREVDVGKAQEAVTDADAAMAEAVRHFGARSWGAGHAAMAVNSAYYAFGRFADAEPFAAEAEALAIACFPAGDPRIAHRIATHAVALGMSGRLEEALVEDEQAIAWALAHLPETDNVFPYLLDNYGMDLRNAGRLREAEAVLRRAIDLTARHHADNVQRRGSLLGKFGNVLDAQGRHREAEAMWLKAIDYDRQVPDLSNPLIGSGELRRAADSAQARGNLPLALSRREQAIALMASHAQPKHPELARARIEYAVTLSLAGRAAEARAIADPAIELVRAGLLEGDFKRMNAEIAYAQVVAAAADAASAYPIAAPVVLRLEKALLDTATARGDLIRFAPLFSTSFAAATRFALATRHDDEAFHDLQLANLSDIVLVNADVAVRAAAGSPAARTSIERLQKRVQERQELDRERVRATASHDGPALARIETAIGAADADIAETTRALDRIYPAFRAIGRPVPTTLASFRARLGPDDILIAPVSLPGETLTIAVTRAGLAWASAPVPRSRVAALLARVRASIDAARFSGGARFDADAARQLYTILLPKALDPLLRAHRHILYTASGALATIPPSLLVAQPLRRGVAPAWLIRTHSISILPTLRAGPTAASSGQAAFLGIGAPRLGGTVPAVYRRGEASALGDPGGTGTASLPPLPHAARELRAMAASFPAADRRVLLADSATERAMKTLPLDRYGVIAIATHGLVNDAVPGLTEPALVLTPPRTRGPLDDGLLTASEVANLHLRADWVILSACDTAGGSDPQGASYSGLTSAFMEAGARALLVSHWAVRDDAAERLTVATVRTARRGIDRATALQRAMIALMRDRSVPGSANPAIWAPFVLVER